MQVKNIMGNISKNLNSNMDKCLYIHSKNISNVLLKIDLIDDLIGESNDFECTKILDEVKYDLITSTYFASIGLYRNAFISLRSSLELGTGLMYFLDRNYEYLLWKNGSQDLIWSVLTDKDNGIYSYKYLSLFEELDKQICDRLYETSKEAYRICSEYVHGKYGFMQTKNNIKIEYDEDKITLWNRSINNVLDILSIVYSIRFNKRIDLLEEDNKETLHSIENKFRFREVNISA